MVNLGYDEKFKMSPRFYKRLDSSFGESKPSRNKWISEGKHSLETPRKRYFNASVVFQPCRSKNGVYGSYVFSWLFISDNQSLYYKTSIFETLHQVTVQEKETKKKILSLLPVFSVQSLVRMIPAQLLLTTACKR